MLGQMSVAVYIVKERVSLCNARISHNCGTTDIDVWNESMNVK